MISTALFGPPYGTIPLVSARGWGINGTYRVFLLGGNKIGGGVSWPVERVGGIKIPIIPRNGDPATTPVADAVSSHARIRTGEGSLGVASG